MRLDALDSAIVRTLLEDARSSLREVARRVDSTPTTVAARLSRLEAAGVVTGASLRLAADTVPGATRIVRGHVPVPATEAVFAAAGRLPGLIELAIGGDGDLWALVQVNDLDGEAQVLQGLRGAGATDLSSRPARRRQGPPLTHLFQGPAEVREPCAECGKAMVDEGVVAQVDGRRVAFCCRSCHRLYLERYAALRARAERPE